MTQQFFFFRTAGYLKRINLADILWLETADNYTKIHEAEGFHIVRISLKLVLQQLKSKRFVQVHRSFAVNVDKIDIINRDFIVLVTDPDHQIPFNIKYLDELLKQIEVIGPKIESGEEFDSEIENNGS